MKRKILKFPEKDLCCIAVISENISFPIVIATYNEWEKEQINYLNSNLKNHFNSLSICKWCINHNIQYQILYPLNIRQIIKHPMRLYDYLILRLQLKSVM